MPSSGIAGSYGGFTPSFLRNLHTVFQGGCISLHSHQQSKRVPFSPTPSQAFIIWWCHSDWCEVIPHCGFDCISLIMSDAKHNFTWLLAICMSSLEKCLFRSFSHFLTGLFVFLVLSCMNCLYILEINYFSVLFAIIFSHSEGCLFTLFVVSFAVQKLLIRSNSFILFLFPLL